MCMEGDPLFNQLVVAVAREQAREQYINSSAGGAYKITTDERFDVKVLGASEDDVWSVHPSRLEPISSVKDTSLLT